MKAIVKIFSVIAMLFIGIGIQVLLVFNRPSSSSAAVFADSILTALGGVRSIATEVVWFCADRLQEEGRFVELAQLASTLTYLDPKTPEVWSYSAWNLAYNISVMMPTYEDRWRWVEAAIKLLRDNGLRLNPYDADLYVELALLFQLKLGTNIDNAAEIYRKNWSETILDATKNKSWHEIMMNEPTMRHIETKYGISDWTNPLSSAVYWADMGLEFAKTPMSKLRLQEIIRQSLQMMRTGTRLQTNAGRCCLSPEHTEAG